MLELRDYVERKLWRQAVVKMIVKYSAGSAVIYADDVVRAYRQRLPVESPSSTKDDDIPF